MQSVRNRVRIPQVKDLATAIRIYYSRHELGIKDIKELFGVENSSAHKLKAIARELMAERECPTYDLHKANTRIAYEAWGLDIKAIEQGYAKLLKYGLYQSGADENSAKKNTSLVADA